MKTTLLILLTSFILISCTPAHFHEYTYLGTRLPSKHLRYTRIVLNAEVDLHVLVGYFYGFIDKKENGLVAIIKTDAIFNAKIIKEVKSSKFGNLALMKPNKSLADDTKNAIQYNLTFTKRKESKTLKKITNDTITIALTTGKELLFVRKSE